MKVAHATQHYLRLITLQIILLLLICSGVGISRGLLKTAMRYTAVVMIRQGDSEDATARIRQRGWMGILDIS